MKIELSFDDTGRGFGLYSEAIDLNSLGPLEIHRATNIEFNNAGQTWEVKDMEGVILFQNPSRQACLDWEHENLPLE